MPLSLRAPLPRPDLLQESRERTDEAALLANPHFSDMLSPKWGRPEKSFALLIRYHKLLIRRHAGRSVRKNTCHARRLLAIESDFSASGVDP